MRDRLINVALSLSSGIITGVVILSFTTKQEDATELKKEVASKISKVEYVRDQELRWNNHGNQHLKDTDFQKEFFQYMREQMKELRQDIRELKKQ